ncbi:RNA polymerase sigma-70 factor [Alistipes sp. OttesenSCG-928-B03]|nr:RNA polymerase sigma-70 factor [Alistipes sp. OttesenSCG-928-B03]
MTQHTEDNRQRLYNDSFETLFSHYARGLVVYAREFLPGGEDAEDVVHDVFVSLWEKMETLSVETAKAYLFRATRNRCIDCIANLKVRSRYQEDMLRDKDRADDSDTGYYVESELRLLMEAAISNLPPQQQKVFTMSKIDGLPAQTIADELNLSRRTVEKHLELASRSVRERLARHLPVLLFLLLNKFLVH